MELGGWLKAASSDFECRITQYSGATRVGVCRAKPGKIETTDATWECSITATSVDNRPDAVDVTVLFSVIAGRARQASVGLCFGFEQWSTDHYVCMPAAVYGGNRFVSKPLPYPPMLAMADRGADKPRIITDVPRLNVNSGRSRIYQLTCDMATPAIGIFDPKTQRGFWLLTHPKTRLGDSGIDLEENDDRSQATLCIAAPGVREDLRYFGNSFSRISEDRGADLAEGDEVELVVRLFAFECQDVPALYDRFVAVRMDLTGPGKRTNVLPYSAAQEIQEEKYNRDNWSEEAGGYYSVGLRENMFANWQIGWVGGLMATHPLLAAGDAISRTRAMRTFDFLFAGGQGRSGLFYGIGDGKRWYGDDFLNHEDKGCLLIRKSADALYFLLKQFDLLDKQGVAVPAHWEHGAKRAADAFVCLWRMNGQFGQFVDADTGEILIGGSSSAGIASAGLALCAQRYGNEQYLDVAEAAARQFYELDVLSGVTTGGPGDALQCPDSESAYGLLESFVVLYEATGQRGWADKAEDMARQCASWCVGYDWPFPKDSLFGRLDLLSAGSIWANVQNKHSAPGICTLSGDSLWKLYRATGDSLYLEMLKDTAHNITQYLSRADRPVGDMPSGWMNERVNLSDWDDKVGGIFHGSCWCEVSSMLTYVEVPGIYVQPDTELVVCFDHVEAQIEGADDGSVLLKVTNPTKYTAKVRIFAEYSSDTGRPLGQNALVGCPVVVLAPGETNTVTLWANGGRAF